MFIICILYLFFYHFSVAPPCLASIQRWDGCSISYLHERSCRTIIIHRKKTHFSWSAVMEIMRIWGGNKVATSKIYKTFAFSHSPLSSCCCSYLIPWRGRVLVLCDNLTWLCDMLCGDNCRGKLTNNEERTMDGHAPKATLTWPADFLFLTSYIKTNSKYPRFFKALSRLSSAHILCSNSRALVLVPTVPFLPWQCLAFTR